MIKINRTSHPSYLSPASKAALTAEFKVNGTAVWNKSSIRDPLLLMSHNKCGYCETILTEESKYMEVDHFFCKKDYPDYVVDWYNLIPSCKRCNIAKHDHNVLTDGMLVDPTIDTPADHLYMVNYRIFGKTKKGEITEREIKLNASKRLVLPRMLVGEAVSDALREIRENLEQYLNVKQTRQMKRKVLDGILNILEEALPATAYCATAATVIACNPDYPWIFDELKKLNWWSIELSNLHYAVLARSLA